MRVLLPLLAVLAMALACGTPPTQGPTLNPSGPKLPPPKAIDPAARGAIYLSAVAAQIQPAWGSFLEDCRLRLPKTHPLNQPALVAIAELRIARDGKVLRRVITGSGNGDFDTAAFDVLGDVSPLPPPPAELVSDDDLVYVRWTFARDARQAGPATAQVIDVRLPLLAIVDKLIARNALPRAIQRILAAPTDPDAAAATERVMIAMLRDGMVGGNGAIRRSAVEAAGRAKIIALAPQVHVLAGPIADTDLRIAAIAASAQLGDPAVAPMLAADLATDLSQRPRIALAKIDALAALGRGSLAAPAIANELGAAKTPSPTGLLALAKLPDPVLAPNVVAWFATDTRTRAHVCEALPGAAPDASLKLIGKGLRDADATVRARCTDAVTRGDKRITGDATILRRLRELATDRDRAVRARAIAALGSIDRRAPETARLLVKAASDPAAEVRVAAAGGAGEAELRTLAQDKDPEVRASAIAALGDRAPDLATRGVTDLSAAVRRASIAIVTDPETLLRLAKDDSPDVATAALVRLAALSGRPAITVSFLAALEVAPPAARVRIALAWLLAR